MSSNRNRRLMGGTALVLALGFAQSAFAQSAPQDPEETQVDDIVVVGSNIAGPRATAALPVVVLDEAQIDATGAVSGDELFRTIPQMGDVLFDSSNNPQTSNAARGDVNSVNLRSLGVGNTLVLLNGRRIVAHPTSQGTSDTGTVPVLSYNSNAIPVAGLRRTEILLDGAAAIYGADAVAGVVNTVLRDNYDGLTFSARYGGAEGTSMEETDLNLFAGRNFDRGNLSLFVNYTDRTALEAADQDFTVTDDLRGLFAEYPDFAGVTALDGRSSNTPWARLSLGTRPTVRSNGTAVTNTSGQFRYQPTSFASCGVNIGSGVCIASGNHNFNTTHRELRYDTRFGTTVRPSVERLNLYVTGRYELDNGIEAFGEAGFYVAESEAVQPPVVNLNSIWIPASNYWNPFGPVTFANGSINPNRLPGLTGVPTTGLPVQMTSYRYVDAGFQTVKVDNYQARFLAGLRGEWGAYDWEAAVLYSEAEAEDVSPNINRTALQAQLALSTPDAYNPFGGGCVDATTTRDCTTSSAAAIDAIVFDMRRLSRTTLSMADFRLSRSDLFQLPGGNVGMAFGLEVRKETQEDDRDANLDGTITFTDSVSGEFSLTNVAAVSPNPDTEGDRTVGSAYLEFAVPLVSPEMSVPLIQQLDVQLAVRVENYSDFGSVTSPKIAVAWDVFDGLRLRGSYSEGFRAPNLEQTNATQYARLGTGIDYIRCEADLRAGRIANFSACGQNTSGLSLLVAGNPNLEPETSVNTSYGLVFQPTFLPPELGAFTLTFDRWRIEQEDIVGLLGVQTALAFDYYERLNGRTNPLVNRGPVDATDIALFTGTGLAPVGDAISINDSFINLLPQTVRGIDVALYWSMDDTPLGSFEASVNGTRLDEFSRDPGPIVNLLFDARATGGINSGTPLPETSDLIGQNGRPEWKVSSSFTWSHGPVRVGLSSQYVSSFEQPGLLGASGNPWEVDSQLVTSLYGQYEFADSTRVRVGVRDLTDEGPPLADGGYRGSVHNPWGRYVYVNIRREF